MIFYGSSRYCATEETPLFHILFTFTFLSRMGQTWSVAF